MSDVLLLGEAMALFVADDHGSLEDVVKYTRTVSGAEVNVGIGLSRLGFDVSYLTKLGDDELGRFIVSFLKKENINTDAIQFDPVYRTGIQLKSKTKAKNGDAVAPYFRKGSAASKIDVEVLDQIDWTSIKLLHVTGIPLALSSSFRSVVYGAIEKAKEHNIMITFDPNIRHKLWSSVGEMHASLLYVARQCDLFLPGIEEAALLSGLENRDEICQWFDTLGVKKMIMKVGPEGSYVYQNGEGTLVEGFKVDEVVDTVGAGDGFAAGVLSALLDGEDLISAARRGNAIGALQVTHWSDNEGLPDRETLNAFMQR